MPTNGNPPSWSCLSPAWTGRNLIDHEAWVISALKMLGLHFAGATAFPQGQGVWRDDARGGVLVFDEPTVIQCYTSETTLEANKLVLRDFLVQMGSQTKQGAVGFVVDRDYFEIRFP